jgi:iron(III) transport system substrate-binding protein
MPQACDRAAIRATLAEFRWEERMTDHDRRQVITGFAAAGGAAVLAGGSGTAWGAETLDAVVEGAKKEGGILWYEAFSREEGDVVLKAFQSKYPFVRKLDYAEVPASQKQARFVQESLAGGPTTDIFLSSSAGLQEFVKQNLLIEADWKGLGVAPSDVKTPNAYLHHYTTSVYVGVYNTNRVSEADAPKNWDDLVLPKWKGRVGTWSRPPGFVVLSSAWGEERVRDYVRKLAALQPRLYGGTFPLAQAVGAGEIDIGVVGSYDASMRILQKGAPIKMVPLDPTPLSLLYGSIARYGKNPNTAKLFVMWMGSPEGALAFEKATFRGNHLVPETNTAKVIEGRNLTFFKPGEEVARAAQLNKLENELATTLQRRG